MHEMSITLDIIRICQQHAGNKLVRSLDIEIGMLSSVVPEAVEFCFEACSDGTTLEGARLNIIRPPGTGRCQSCGTTTPMMTLYDACINCGGYNVVIESGEEMRVKEIEVED